MEGWEMVTSISNHRETGSRIDISSAGVYNYHSKAQVCVWEGEGKLLPSESGHASLHPKVRIMPPAGFLGLAHSPPTASVTAFTCSKRYPGTFIS